MEKGKTILIIFLIIIILGLVGFIVYDKLIKVDEVTTKDEVTKENKEKEEEENKDEILCSKNYTYKDIAGFYIYRSDNMGLTLQLEEKGTFYYTIARQTASRAAGNYTIVDNIIYLNYMFEMGNDAGGMFDSDKTNTMIINEDNTLTDNFDYQISTKPILTKTNEKLEIGEQESFDYILHNYILNNNAYRQGLYR